MLKQVRMVDRDRHVQDVAWVGTDFAVVGLLVGLRGRPGIWEVVEVYEGTRSAATASERARDHARQRQASDI